MVLPEVVLDGPHVVDPEAVGEGDVLQRLAEHPGLVSLTVGGGQLDLVEHAELHDPT